MIEAKLTGSWNLRLFFVGLFTFGLGALILHLVSRRYVKTLDQDAVTLRNGRRFEWRDLQKVHAQYWRRYGKSWLNHVDLKFPGGTAGVFFRMYANGGEVLDFVRKKTNQPLPLSQ